jgi:hypothetical protein
MKVMHMILSCQIALNKVFAGMLVLLSFFRQNVEKLVDIPQ